MANQEKLLTIDLIDNVGSKDQFVIEKNLRNVMAKVGCNLDDIR